MEEKNIAKKILSIIETIPGVLGFSSILNSKKNDDDCIKIQINNGDVKIALGIIINRNITIKNLENEIFDALNFFFKKKNFGSLSLSKINLYIKGVK